MCILVTVRRVLDLVHTGIFSALLYFFENTELFPDNFIKTIEDDTQSTSN